MSALVSANGNFTNARANTFVIASKLAADPPSQGVDRAILYLKDDGAGNAQLKIKVGSNAPIIFGGVGQGIGFKGVIQNSLSSDEADSKIRADLSEVNFNDFSIAPAQNLVCDKAVTGSINGMQAAAVNSTWNKLFYARKRSDGSEGLWGVRAKNYRNDTSFTTAVDTEDVLRVGAADRVKLAQGFQLVTPGLVEKIEFQTRTPGTLPTGNYWFTIEADAAGNPSGTPLVTSAKYNAGRVSQTGTTVIWVSFPNPVSLLASTQYHLVLQGDYTPHATIHIVWKGVIAGGYASGSGKKFDGTTWTAATSGDFYFKIFVTENDTALSLPSGYNQFVQIGWFYLNSSGNIKRFIGINRSVVHPGTAQWLMGSTASINILFNLEAFVPPVHSPIVYLGTASDNTNGAGQVGRITFTDGSTVVAAKEDAINFVNTVGAGIGTPRSPNNGRIMLNYQGLMLSTDTGGEYIWIMGYEW